MAGRTLLLLLVTAFVGCSLGRRHQRPQFCADLPGDEDGSFLWMVKQDPPSYFFGTIHVPYTRVWEHVPYNTKKAFEMSDNVMFELALTDPATITALTTCQLLPQGKSLADVLPGELYARLRSHLSYIRSQMPHWLTPPDNTSRWAYANYLFDAITGNWERKRPVWVMLMVNSLTESDIRSREVPVLDLYLAQEAEKMTKTTGAVEEVDEQCRPLNGLNFSQVVFALNHTLSLQEQHKSRRSDKVYTTDDLIRHYNCGDLDAVIFSQDTAQVPYLGNSSLPPMEAATAQLIDQYFREELIYRRNERMGSRVVQVMLEHPERSFFFAFGAGHFLGNRTVLDVVRAAGFQVMHVGPDYRLKKHKRPTQRGGAVLPDTKVLKNFSHAPNRLLLHQQMDPAFTRSLLESRERTRPPSTTPPPPKKAHFNHLWVRIDADQPASSSASSKDGDALAVEEGLRVWYGLSGGRPSVRCEPLLLLPLLLLLHHCLKGLLLSPSPLL
ncbi:metalloprotease TIKI2 [Hyalella azteca]|uniref:Metalloprotease TIKI homolog n=1 Tax=Hyalella azteca TaxID=294128 RepID=A0A8B7PB06_HYAAZ|nr:metalloprotease TIKI2 [Hyalella azteca]